MNLLAYKSGTTVKVTDCPDAHVHYATIDDVEKWAAKRGYLLVKDEEILDMVEDPGSCPECGAVYELVRPGKSQPTCQCWELPETISIAPPLSIKQNAGKMPSAHRMDTTK